MTLPILCVRRRTREQHCAEDERGFRHEQSPEKFRFSEKFAYRWYVASE